MEKTFQYHQQIFAGLELEIYNDLLKKDKIFLQCRYNVNAVSSGLSKKLPKSLDSDANGVRTRVVWEQGEGA